MARAELILYMGLCPASIHVGEGKFIRDSASPYEKERYLKCMNVVLQTLDEIKMIVPSIYNDIYVYGTYLIREGSNAPLAYIQYCDKGVLRDEKKAIVLTEFVEKKYTRCKGTY